MSKFELRLRLLLVFFFCPNQIRINQIQPFLQRQQQKVEQTEQCCHVLIEAKVVSTENTHSSGQDPFEAVTGLEEWYPSSH